MDYIGYFVSFVLVCVFITVIIIVSGFLSKKIEGKIEEKIQGNIIKNKEKVYLEKKRLVGGSKKSKYLMKLYNNFSVLYYINQLKKNGGNKYNIRRLVELINSKYFSEDLFDRDLMKKSVGDLNKIKAIIKKDLENETFFRKTIVAGIITPIVIPAIKYYSYIFKITKGITDLTGSQLYAIGIALSILILLYLGIIKYVNKREFKKIYLDSDYIISMIDIVIKRKL